MWRKRKKKRVKNSEYASLIAAKCQDYGVQLIKPFEGIKKQYNLDLWPIFQNNQNKYVIASHFYTSSYQQSILGSEKLILKPTKNHVKIGKKITKVLINIGLVIRGPFGLVV